MNWPKVNLTLLVDPASAAGQLRLGYFFARRDWGREIRGRVHHGYWSPDAEREPVRWAFMARDVEFAPSWSVPPEDSENPPAPDRWRLLGIHLDPAVVAFFADPPETVDLSHLGGPADMPGEGFVGPVEIAVLSEGS